MPNMSELNTKVFDTESDMGEVDIVLEPNDIDCASQNHKKYNISKELKEFFRFLKKKNNSLLEKVLPRKLPQTFTNILYLTLDCPPYTPGSSRSDTPIEYINSIRKQYPENDLRIMLPIINLTPEKLNLSKLRYEINDVPQVLEKTSIHFEFVLQNKKIEAAVYKFPKNRDNIEVYGVCSPAFSYCENVSELAKLEYLAPFLKAARISIKKLRLLGFEPQIVHSESMPFYLGSEFAKDNLRKIKVLQTINDFTQIETSKIEAFWAALNLADKSSMKKICNDKIIKKCITELFNLHNVDKFYPMKDCLKFIHKNYYKFRINIDKNDDIEENAIFNKLNARTLKLFPKMFAGDKLYFNPYIYTLKCANYWITISNSYYNDIFNNPKLSGKMFPYIIKTKEKSDFVSFGFNTDKYGFNAPQEVYQAFDIDNFRELRIRNKTALLKEFTPERIRTNFVDPTLFIDEEVQILGSLEVFYDSPLLFVHTDTEIFASGVDILFNTILKLFELQKNIQVIICIKDGLKNNFINSWIEFLKQNKYFEGKLVFIDGNINVSKFYASSDITLIPRRLNKNTPEHYLAMYYGCVPVVARNGILNDTISDIFDNISCGSGLKTKTGLITETNADELFLAPVLKALNIFQHNHSSWNLLVKNCLLKECGWSFDVLEKYHRIYQKLL